MSLKKVVFSFILLLYVIPTFVQFRYTEQNTISGVYVGLPIMQSGDEPHYYITLYSLVNDGDMYLTNNYDNAIYNNGSDAGTKKLQVYERHTRFFDSENQTIIAVPLVNGYRDTTYVATGSTKEILGHPLGLPLFAFLFLFPFKNTAMLEHLAIYLTLVFSLLGILAFYKLMLFYHNEEKKALFFTCIFALATQYWYYSKTFWVEPYLASFFIIAWYFVVVKKSSWAYFISGILWGFGFLMKLPFLLIILPYYMYLIHSCLIIKTTKIRHIIIFSIPLFISFLAVLCLNYYFTKNPFMFDKMDSLGFILPFNPLFNWFFSPTFGLFIFSPILVFTFFGIKKFWNTHKIDCLSLGLMGVLFTLFWTMHNADMALGGGGGYSGRYLIPLIPIFMICCSFIKIEEKIMRYSVYILLGISVVINSIAVLAYPAFVDTNIIISFGKIIHFFIEWIL